MIFELGDGNVNVEITFKKKNYFIKFLSEITNIEVTNEGDLFSIISDLSKTKKKFDRIAYALEEVEAKGYGIVTPCSIDDLELEEPEMIKTRFSIWC